MEDEILLGLVPAVVRVNLERLFWEIQDSGVDGGMTTSDNIDSLERYQQALSEVKP